MQSLHFHETVDMFKISKRQLYHPKIGKQTELSISVF